MNIKLYKTTDPVNKVNKALTAVADINGEPHEKVSETEMQIRLTISKLANVKGSNYCYIAETNRYYYISPNYEIENQTVIIYLKEDVLMSLKTQLLSQTCTISRNEQLANAYLVDNAYQLKTYKNIFTRSFPNGLTDNSIILMTIG